VGTALALCLYNICVYGGGGGVMMTLATNKLEPYAYDLIFCMRKICCAKCNHLATSLLKTSI
jgi:hypothetical protein